MFAFSILILINLFNLYQSFNFLSSEVKLDYLSADCIKIPFSLGSQKAYLDLLYETGSWQTSVMSMKTQQNKTSTTLQKTTNNDVRYDSIHRDFIRGNEMLDFLAPVSLSSTIQLFNYINVSNHEHTTWNYDGIVGLGRNYSNDYSSQYHIRFSFLHNLYNNQLINKRIFSHRYKEKTHAIVSFGSVPLIYQEKPLPDSKCKCETDKDDSLLNHLWSCKLHSISLSNGIKINSSQKPVIFSTGRNQIIMPFKEGMEIMMEMEVFSNHSCYIEPVEERNYKLTCRKFFLNTFPEMHFNFGTFELVYKTMYMFVNKYDQNMRSVFKSVFSVNPSLDYWVFGNPILRGYDIAFDYDNNEIQFLNAPLVLDNNNNDQLIPKDFEDKSIILIGILIIVIFLGILGIIINTCKKLQLQ